MPQCHILCEGAPGQRSPLAQAGNATRDDDVHVAQSVVAIAIVGCRNRIGHQRDAVWPGNPDSQFQHRRRHMLEIGDQLERHPVIKQERRCGTWLTMMQRWHRIEEVGCNTRAGVNCLLDNRRIRTGVSNRHDCSRSDELRDRDESATNLGRQRHHRDLAAGKQLDQLIVGDTTENGGIVCAAVVRRQPWPFKVDTRQRAVGDERKQRLNLSQ